MVFQELKDMKDGASEKAYIHVRINISGSPLECPGKNFSPSNFSQCLHFVSLIFNILLLVINVM